MTTEIAIEPEPAPAQDGAPRRRSRWALSWHGVRTVAALELRQRVRSTKWIVALVVWTVIVGLVTWLTYRSAAVFSFDAGDSSAGRLVFDIVIFFVLLLGLLVAPTLSSSSINGDRNAGTLAILQVTLLSPAEIAVGKLLAAWTAALAFLAASVPFIVFAFAQGGLPVAAVLTTVGLLAVVLAVVVAVGLGFSARVPRTATSAVLSYVTVAALSVISAILFGLSAAVVQSDVTVRVFDVKQGWHSTGAQYATVDDCVWREYTRREPRFERTWWLLAVNPFVIVADATPENSDSEWPEGILDSIRYGVREARMGIATEVDECRYYAGRDYVSPVPERDPDRSPVWPWGLAFNLALGAAGLATAVHRLSVPVRKLPRGTRIA